MSIRSRCVVLGSAVVALLGSDRGLHAVTYVGPIFPVTGSPAFSFAAVGSAGSAGGRTITYTGIDQSQYVSLYWGPNDASAVKMSLNSTTATTVLPYLSSTASTATFQNNSVFYASPGGAAPASGNYVGTGTVGVTGASWVGPVAGASTPVLASITGTGFVANIAFTTNAGGAGTPINALPTSTGVAGSYGGGFFYIPRMRWTAADGNWDTAANWNHTSILPYVDSPVTITNTGVAAIAISGPAAAAGAQSINLSGTLATATLKLGNGALTVPGGTSIGTNGVLSGGGTLNGNVDVASGGALETTNTALAISGTFNTAGKATFTLSNISAGPINAGGAASVSGNLVLTTQGGFNSPYLTTFDLVTGASRTGKFATVQGVSLSPTKSLAVVYGATNVQAIVARPGDANLEGTVNFSDLLTLAANYGTAGGATWSVGDFTGDGSVNFDDLLALAANYGAGPAVLASDWALAQSLVPEPSAIGMLAGAGSVLVRRVRPRSR
ncbi:MAG: hypothetical protein QM770_08510 [Tepidisphaeraceae bacterium]